MALSSLAEVSDLSAWVGRDIDSSDPRAGAVLSHASTRVRAYTGMDWEDIADIPDVVRDVVVRVAARAWRNPEDLDSVTLDDGTKRWGSVRGLALTAEDKEDLAQFLPSNHLPAGLGIVGTYRDDAFSTDAYVPTGPPPSGYPFPWYSSDDLP